MMTYRGYLFDLDGTIYLGDQLLPGAAETIHEIKSSGAVVRYVTNNPTRAAADYASKLTHLGIPTARGEVITSVTATTMWLTTHHPDARVYAIGEQSLLEELTRAGITLCEDPQLIDIVLASFDRTFTYSKLQIAFDALWRHQRAILVSTNPDRFCPYPGGRGEPDAAAIVAAIEASTSVSLTRTFGKPSPHLASLALESMGAGVAPGECVVVGDRLETDIAMGARAGMDTALVLTGDSTREDIPSAPEPPTRVITELAQLLSR